MFHFDRGHNGRICHILCVHKLRWHIFGFFWPLPLFVFYLINVDKEKTSLDYLVNIVCEWPLTLIKLEVGTPKPRTHVLKFFFFSAFQYSWPFVIHWRCSWTLPWIQCHVLLRVHVFFHSETWFECSNESRWTWCIWRTIWQPLITMPRVSIFLKWEDIKKSFGNQNQYYSST